jgi:ABC-2 type transport system ATP-binding protein
MLGLLKPNVGRTTIFGRDSEGVASRQDVGFLPENPYFYKHLTGRETLHFYGKLCGMTGSSLKDRAQEMLKLTGMEHAAERRVGGYSKGMLQRIGLAQALIHAPRLLILDEPTAGVDPVGSRRIRDLIMEMKGL